MYSHQRSKVTCLWKINVVERHPSGGQGVHWDPNAIATQRAMHYLPNTCQKMRGGKHVKVEKRQRQDISVARNYSFAPMNCHRFARNNLNIINMQQLTFKQ